MTKQTAFYVAIFATAALAVGWYARGWREASDAVITTLRRLAGLTRERGRNFEVTVLLAVVFAAVLYVVVTSHK